MSLFQEWILGFDSKNPVGLWLPTLVVLNQLHLEYGPLVPSIASCLGPILQVDLLTEQQWKLRFCVAMDSRIPWPAFLELPGLAGTLALVEIEYELPPPLSLPGPNKTLKPSLGN